MNKRVLSYGVSRKRGWERSHHVTKFWCVRTSRKRGHSLKAGFSILYTGCCEPAFARCSQMTPWPSDLEIHPILNASCRIHEAVRRIDRPLNYRMLRPRCGIKRGYQSFVYQSGTLRLSVRARALLRDNINSARDSSRPTNGSES